MVNLLYCRSACSCSCWGWSSICWVCRAGNPPSSSSVPVVTCSSWISFISWGLTILFVFLRFYFFVICTGCDWGAPFATTTWSNGLFSCVRWLCCSCILWAFATYQCFSSWLANTHSTSISIWKPLWKVASPGFSTYGSSRSIS